MFSRDAIKNDFGRAAKTYGEMAVLQKTIREEAIKLARDHFQKNAKILDLGCGSMPLEGGKNWDIIGADIAYGMCAVANGKGVKIINAAATALPLKDESVDGVFSSLMLQWVERPEAVIKEILRVLKPDGVAVISTFVHGSLRELAAAFSAIDDIPHISDFITSEQLLMRAAHAGAVVLEVRDETYEEEIENAISLMKSIKQIGAANKNINRKKGLMTKSQLAKIAALYEGKIASWQVLTMVIGKA